MGSSETLIILSILIMSLFAFFSAKHYFSRRRNENHDSYLVMSESCHNNKMIYTKCPRVEMWGFKFSTLLFLTGLNFLLLLYIIGKRL